MRKRCHVLLPTATEADLEALHVVTGESRSSLVATGIAQSVAGLPPDKREAFVVVRGLVATRGPRRNTPPEGEGV